MGQGDCLTGGRSTCPLASAQSMETDRSSAGTTSTLMCVRCCAATKTGRWPSNANPQALEYRCSVPRQSCPPTIWSPTGKRRSITIFASSFLAASRREARQVVIQSAPERRDDTARFGERNAPVSSKWLMRQSFCHLAHDRYFGVAFGNGS